MAMHNDEPTLFDELDRWKLVREIGDAVATCTPPQVFGIHGDWGLGKTSALHQLQWHLTGSCQQQTEEQCARVLEDRSAIVRRNKEQFVVVWFEAWRYQHEAAPIVALLHEMRAQLDWWIKLGETIEETAAVALHGALLSLEDLTKKVGFQASKFMEAQDTWNREHLAAELPANTLRTHLNDAIELLLQRGIRSRRSKRRLVVLVDDLDRCEPETAFRLLEGIKIYLGVRSCVFVLGMNQKIIEDAIAKSLPQGDGNKSQIRAEAYLEKLCQNVWRLPTVDDAKRRLCSWLSHDRNLQRRVEMALNLSDPCLPPNPRRLKGFANLLSRMAQRLPALVEDESENTLHTQLLLVVAYIYQFHHNLFVRWEYSPSLYDDILEWSRLGRNMDVSSRLSQGPLGQLIRPYSADTDDEFSSPPSYLLTSRHPDPTESNVFWIQPVVVALGNKQGADFRRYMTWPE